MAQGNTASVPNDFRTQPTKSLRRILSNEACAIAGYSDPFCDESNQYYIQYGSLNLTTTGDFTGTFVVNQFIKPTGLSQLFNYTSSAQPNLETDGHDAGYSTPASVFIGVLSHELGHFEDKDLKYCQRSPAYLG